MNDHICMRPGMTLNYSLCVWITWSKMLSSSISMTELVTPTNCSLSLEKLNTVASHVSNTTSTCCEPYWRIRYSHTQSSWTCNSWGPEGRWTGETETMVAAGRLSNGCIKYTSTLPQTTLRKWSSPPWAGWASRLIWFTQCNEVAIYTS